MAVDGNVFLFSMPEGQKGGLYLRKGAELAGLSYRPSAATKTDLVLSLLHHTS